MKYVSETNSYTETAKLDNGYIAVIEFYGDIYSDSIDYTVALAIGKKKKDLHNWINGNKNNITGKETGKDLLGLIWAKNKILEFEKYLMENKKKTIKQNIVICWEDKKRKRAYKRMAKYGYKYDNLRKAFYKNIC